MSIMRRFIAGALLTTTIGITLALVCSAANAFQAAAPAANPTASPSATKPAAAPAPKPTPTATVTTAAAAVVKPSASATGTKPAVAKPETARQKADRLKKDADEAEAQALRQETEAAEKSLNAAKEAEEKAKNATVAAEKRVADLKGKANQPAATPNGTGGKVENTKKVEQPLTDGSTLIDALNAEFKTVTDHNQAIADWTKETQGIVNVQTQDLVVPLALFREKMGLGADFKSVLTPGSLVLLDHDRLESAKRVSAAMVRVAKSFREDTDPDQVLAAWHTERDSFLKSINNIVNSAAADVFGIKQSRRVQPWQDFLTSWENAVLVKGKEHLRDALLQAGPIIHGLMIGLDNAHIESMLNGGALSPATKSGAGSASGSAGRLRPTHLTIHHTRVMNNIIVRHGRRMARIGY